MKRKRKRAPGAGRPVSEFGKLGAVMGVRLPEDLKGQLRQAAEQGDRSLSGELIRRLRASFGHSRRAAPDQWQVQQYSLLSEALSTIAEEITASAERVAQTVRLAQQDLPKPRKRGGKQ
jgi:hypothetical protein